MPPPTRPSRIRSPRTLLRGVAVFSFAGAAALAGQSLAAQAPPPPKAPPYLVLVREVTPQAQPTHRIEVRTRVDLVLVGDDSRAPAYSVCLRGPQLKKCWRRELGPYHDLTRIRTRTPHRAGVYTVTWRVGTARTSWKLRVVRPD